MQVTLNKYYTSLNWLEANKPSLQISDLDRKTYQTIINDYAQTHEKQTVLDFHHQLKSSLLDALEDNLLEYDPTRKVIIKGKLPKEKKQKYLSHFELQLLLNSLQLDHEIGWNWLIFLLAKTGMRFSEALAITPSDIDLAKQTIRINKTWDYKNGNGFSMTKNRSSNRMIQLDWQTTHQLAPLLTHLPFNQPIFIKGNVYNSTVNNFLKQKCIKLQIPIISLHGLRHTHASVLMSSGVSLASISKRLGHSNIETTQRIYFHLIKELESKDLDLLMRTLSTLG